VWQQGRRRQKRQHRLRLWPLLLLLPGVLHRHLLHHLLLLLLLLLLLQAPLLSLAAAQWQH
jgi:hypothetical protein